MLNQKGREGPPLARITCYREPRKNVVQLSSLPPPGKDSPTSFEEVPGPTLLPDATNPWVHLRIQFHEEYCIVWNQDIPLGICHFPLETSLPLEAAFSISRINCQQVQFGNIALVREKFAQRLRPRLNENLP